LCLPPPRQPGSQRNGWITYFEIFASTGAAFPIDAVRFGPFALTFSTRNTTKALCTTSVIDRRSDMTLVRYPFLAPATWFARDGWSSSFLFNLGNINTLRCHFSVPVSLVRVTRGFRARRYGQPTISPVLEDTTPRTSPVQQAISHSHPVSVSPGWNTFCWGLVRMRQICRVRQRAVERISQSGKVQSSRHT
jgi:hypothetical protein